MRFLIISPPDLRTARIVDAFKSFGYEIELYIMDEFYRSCSYFDRKLYKFGYRGAEEKFNLNLIEEIDAKCREFRPEFILILCGLCVPVTVQKFLAQYKIILWLWDPAEKSPVLKNLVSLADEVFCFDYDEQKILSEKYNALTHYLPPGFNDKIYFPRELSRDIDILFVGFPYRDRIELMEKICTHAVAEGWSLKIGGKWYDTRHFWKKYFFGRKYPHVINFLDNRFIEPAELSQLYSRSKICLNINAVGNRSISPRTFEIAATKSFQLMNDGQHSHGYMNFDADLAIYDDAEDLIEKIKFYLASPELREKIAASGYKSVVENCTPKKLVEKFLEASEVVKNL